LDQHLTLKYKTFKSYSEIKFRNIEHAGYRLKTNGDRWGPFHRAGCQREFFCRSARQAFLDLIKEAEADIESVESAKTWLIK
jgi:hypothetical protein